jgi:PTH2 family peptidyl-tRNA hydrolase
MDDLKQVIILKEELSMSRGKQIAQACHASLKSYQKASNKAQKAWEEQGAKKIALSNDDTNIKERFQQAKSLQIPASLVKDAGHTELQPGTITALGLGPAEEEKINKVTGDLKLIK